MKNKLTLGIMALGVIALLGAGLVAAFPMMGGNWDVSEEDRESNQLFMEQVQEAIEEEDFAEWQTLMQSQITLENFNEHVERHVNMEELRAQKEQCLEDPENCPNHEEGEMQERTFNGQGQMHQEGIEFNQEQRQHKWAFWKGFRGNRA